MVMSDKRKPYIYCKQCYCDVDDEFEKVQLCIIATVTPGISNKSKEVEEEGKDSSVALKVLKLFPHDYNCGRSTLYSNSRLDGVGFKVFPFPLALK